MVKGKIAKNLAFSERPVDREFKSHQPHTTTGSIHLFYILYDKYIWQKVHVMFGIISDKGLVYYLRNHRSEKR